MVDYVLPSGVRIADADRVRLGAYLASGTTVMHEGFVNFNAGTLGASMVEGRISAGVIVGDGTDVGGGASIMGTLSGGGQEVITIGERCLIGAESGVGISLGDDCVIEAGLYVTSGTKVTLPDGRVVKGAELSGMSGLLFLRDSVSGRVEARPRTTGAITLNAARPGSNDLEIEVTNLWINRMIGDEQLPEDSDRNPDGTLKAWPAWLEADKPSPTGRLTFTSHRLWKKGDALVPSGLLGPVTVQTTVVTTSNTQ